MCSYIASVFFLLDAELLDFVLKLALCAASSWIVFGGMLCLRFKRVTPIEWADICLSTMAIGALVLFEGAQANILLARSSAATGLQAVVLIVSDASMGAWFVTRSARKGIPVSTALWAWVFGLNGVFALLMVLLP
jgi:hypothetical protein